MDWNSHIRNQLARLGKSVDDTVIDEFAQHAAAAFEASRADGASMADAEREVRALIASWSGLHLRGEAVPTATR